MLLLLRVLKVVTSNCKCRRKRRTIMCHGKQKQKRPQRRNSKPWLQSAVVCASVVNTTSEVTAML